ncbi:MAG: glycosyltransferase [Aquisalimonadaceae bacterium]
MAVNKQPLVSIVVPARNEELTIGRCLEAILASDYPSHCLQVIVVDNNSTDQTAAVAAIYPVQVIQCKQPGVSATRNKGAEHAEGEILGFIDSDCIISQQAISTAVTLLQDRRVGACGGTPIAGPESNWIESAWALKKESALTTTDILSTASFYLNRSVFFDVGCFNYALPAGEDTELSRRIRKKYSLRTHPHLDVIHLGYPNTFRGFFRRQLWQSSRYLQSRKYGIDYTLIVTTIYLLSLIAFLTAISFGLYRASFFPACIVLGLPPALGLYRIRKSGARPTVLLFLQSSILNAVYLTARSCGLIVSLGHYLRPTAQARA